MSGARLPFPVCGAVGADPRESQGIYVDADTVYCEDCGYAGMPISSSDKRCRKCASESVVHLLGIVAPEAAAKESDAVL